MKTHAASRHVLFPLFPMSLVKGMINQGPAAAEHTVKSGLWRLAASEQRPTSREVCLYGCVTGAGLFEVDFFVAVFGVTAINSLFSFIPSTAVDLFE